MRSFLIRWGIHAFSLWVAASLVSGVSFAGGDHPRFADVLLVAAVWGFVNAFIKPFLALATCGLYVITLGLFTFVMNAFMLELTSWITGGLLEVDGFWAAFKGALVISLTGTVLTWLLDPPDRQDDDGAGPRGGRSDGLVLEGR